MGVETIVGFGAAEGGRVCVFVYDGGGVGPFGEDAGCDPGLENEPAAEVYAADFVGVVVE